MIRNSIEPRDQKLWGKDGSLLDEDKIRRSDERRTLEVREFDAATARHIVGIRVDHHCQYLLFARSLKHGRVKLSVMCALLYLQLWTTTASFLLQGTLKLHTHLLILFLRLDGLAQVYLDDFTQGHLIESYRA